MSWIGKKSRLRKFFRADTRNTLIVAMDHGRQFGPLKGIENAIDTLEKVAKGGADAVIMTPGLAWITLPNTSVNISLLVRVDGSTTVVGPDLSDDRLISNVKAAVQLDADAVVAMAYIGSRNESQLLNKIGLIASECQDWGIPLISEMLPSGVLEYHFKTATEKVERSFDPKHVIICARVGAELGSDVIKTYYTGDKETFKAVIRGCPVPIVFTGGPAVSSLEEWFTMLKTAIECGAKGAAVGRNVWQHEDPTAMTRAIATIIHGKGSVMEALKELKKK